MRVYTVHADINVEVQAENAADARAKFEAHVKALDEFAGIEIGEEGVYTWTSFIIAPKDDIHDAETRQDAPENSQQIQGEAKPPCPEESDTVGEPLVLGHLSASGEHRTATAGGGG